MRLPLVALLVPLLALLAGCSDGLAEATARAAPARLARDMGPDGDLRSLVSTLALSGAVDGPGQSIAFTMEIETTTTLFHGDALQVVVRFLQLDVGGRPPPQELGNMTTTVRCWPNAIQLDAQGTTRVLPNPRGTCAPPTDENGTVQATQGLDPQAAALIQQALDQTRLPEYRFERVLGDDRARYTLVRESAWGGIDVDLTLTDEAVLEDGRFVRSTLAGEADLGGGAAGGMEANFDVHGSNRYAYGPRQPAPDLP